MTTAAERVSDPWGPAHPYDRGSDWPRRQDQYLLPGVGSEQVQQWVPSACLLCSNGCGLDIAVIDGAMVGVRGRTDDRVNHGRLGPKGLYGWQGQQHDRLTVPLMRDESGRLAETSWEAAMTRIVEHSRRQLEQHGPGSHGFYTSGQLMLEEYYTLSVIAKAGIGTPHTDGNTRLCTATAAASLKESFGCDGQPASYTDIDDCQALFAFGHNIAETQTVLWRRILDRLDGRDAPALVCVDPRRTPVAERAAVHLPVRPGTNLGLVNGLLHELLAHDWIDPDWVKAHTAGYPELAELVADYPPERVAAICDVPAGDLRAAAEIFGTTDRVLSTVLQGFYQSHQATASACAVNNLHLLRGMIGRPGAGVLQMNGQPTAQNNRECGANGDLPGFRNFADPEHVRALARLWDVAPEDIPHDGPPTHVMRMFELAESGEIGFLWIAGTNPAVSLPDLNRVRSTLSGPQCFTVVSDAFETETTRLADVVLPVALWGEKTGTYTNTDRTVHLSEQAVSPPGRARGDFDIWLDYARRMELRSRSGARLPPWRTPPEAFDAWRECSAGRPCDYSGMDYDRLRGNPIQWPCNSEASDGTERLYTDFRFPSAPGECETYGHDLETGESWDRRDHRRRWPSDRARLTAVEYSPAPTGPDTEHPFRLITGRTVHHFHTRTKTGRAAQLQQAAPHAWVELSRGDAADLAIAENDLVRVSTEQGHLDLPARIRDCETGTVFIPFHYGEAIDGRGRPANLLTSGTWDPVSKQPAFKLTGAAVHRIDAVEGT